MNATLRLRHDELAKHRASAALHTEQSLADAMGADRATVNKVMNGKSRPSSDFVASLVRAFDGLTICDLWEVVPTSDSGESK